VAVGAFVWDENYFVRRSNAATCRSTPLIRRFMLSLSPVVVYLKDCAFCFYDAIGGWKACSCYR
jgi:hypothetical protein